MSPSLIGFSYRYRPPGTLSPIPLPAVPRAWSPLRLPSRKTLQDPRLRRLSFFGSSRAWLPSSSRGAGNLLLFVRWNSFSPAGRRLMARILRGMIRGWRGKRSLCNEFLAGVSISDQSPQGRRCVGNLRDGSPRFTKSGCSSRVPQPLKPTSTRYDELRIVSTYFICKKIQSHYTLTSKPNIITIFDK